MKRNVGGVFGWRATGARLDGEQQERRGRVWRTTTAAQGPVTADGEREEKKGRKGRKREGGEKMANK
jgi:hypothetical protein